MPPTVSAVRLCKGCRLHGNANLSEVADMFPLVRIGYGAPRLAISTAKVDTTR